MSDFDKLLLLAAQVLEFQKFHGMAQKCGKYDVGGAIEAMFGLTERAGVKS